MFFRGYFSSAVKSVIVTKSKIISQQYIERIIKEEINGLDKELFYENVGENGLVYASFDVNKANIILSNVISSLNKSVQEFNDDCSFEVSIPFSYFFMASSYILPDLKVDVNCSSLLYYEAKLVSDVLEYGINSSLVSLNILININYQVMVPFMYNDISNVIEIPLVLEVINGEVPEVLFSY